MQLPEASPIMLRRSDLARLANPHDLFDRPGPLVLEVGFGDGRFLVSLNRSHPEWNLLGVEVSLASVSRAYRRLVREGVGHARVFKGNARFIVRDMLPDSSLDRIYVNFPDPWPRKKHAAHRLLQRDFFGLISHRLRPGGALLLTTDHAEYYEFACAEAEATGLFRLSPGAPPEGTLQTKYALKWQEQERPIYHVHMDLLRRDSDPHPPLIPHLTMQHALLSGDLASVQSFEKIVRRFPGGTVIIADAYRTLRGEGLIFPVVIQETDLRQEVLIRAWPKGEGIFVGLQPFGDPMGTKGVKEAVRAVADWLVEQGLTLEKTWI